MPTPAPFTPQTLATIRDMARVQEAPVIAEAINWELHRLARVAKAHGIELMNADPVVSVVSRLTPPSPLDEVIDGMSRRQREVLLILKNEIDGRWIPSREIADRIGVSAENVSNILRKTAKRRVGLCGFKIESLPGYGSGYRLVTAGRESE